MVTQIQKDVIEVYDLLRINLTDNLTEAGMHDNERQILLQIFDAN